MNLILLLQDDEGRGNLIHYQPEEDFFSDEEAESLAFQKYGLSFTPRFTERFQWLPSEFEIGQNNSVRIASYINNLHPEVHAGLYLVIEQVFCGFIPLFAKVLKDVQESVKTNTEGIKVPEDMLNEFKMAGKTIQVITNLRNILLTPAKPNYPGEQGQFNLQQKTFTTESKLFFKYVFQFQGPASKC